MNQLKYLIGSLFSLPFLPLMYFQGKRIRKTVPSLPEAQGNIGSVINAKSDSLNLLCLGESTISGVGVKTHEQGFTGYLARYLSEKLNKSINWQVIAKSGYTANQVSKLLIPKIPKNDYDLIVIGLGGNDAFKLNSPKKWNIAISDLIEKLQKEFPNAQLFFTNMPPIKMFPAFTFLIKMSIGNLAELLGKELQNIVKEYPKVHYNSEVINLKNWSGKVNGEIKIEQLFSDGVHPSGLTYKLWAEDMSDFIVDRFRLN